jgi:pimeloyl-ACP methyl ester carboxylesterase
LADRREADALSRKLRRAMHLIGDSFPGISALVAPATMRVTLGEVTQYVGNRGGIAEDIREMLRREIRAAWEAGDRVLVAGHSFGSVIAYDTLWQLSRQSRDAGRVELFLTLGSPLATRFIRQGLKGADREGKERYPANIDRWVNVSARGEMVALHRRVKPFFVGMLEQKLIGAIEDELIYNHFRGTHGLDVHRSYGYLNHPAVAGRICRWLGYSS